MSEIYKPDFIDIAKKNQVDVKTLDKIFLKANDTLTFEDWQNVLDEVIKFYNNNSEKNEDTDKFISELIFFLEKVVEMFIMNGKSYEEIKDKILEYFSSTEHNLDNIETGDRRKDGKRIPNFSESLEATLERLVVLQEIQKLFSHIVDSIIAGGSLSYGPFYNVRKEKNGTPSSDIDTIMLINNNFFDSEKWSDFIKSDLFTTEQKTNFFERMKIFISFSNGEADILSQKFEVIRDDDRFDVSIHFVQQDVFDKLVMKDVSEEELTSSQDRDVTLLDFREKDFSYKKARQKNIDGELVEFEVNNTREPISGGSIAELPIYMIRNGKYCPGIYQNVILPRCYVFYDKDGSTSQDCNSFYTKVDNLSGNKSVLPSHIRSSVFPVTLQKELL